MPSLHVFPLWREPVICERERARVQSHLRRAEGRVERADTRRLDPLRRLVRALLLEELRRYRRRGLFPQNCDFPRQTPYFVDAAGTRCAVAHLLELSGEGALVRRIARARNHARVHALADDPQLTAWLLAAGISLEEAAAIQPAYCETSTEAASNCVCTPAYGASYNATPLAAVLEGRLIGQLDPATAQVQLDAIHGSTTRYKVGDEVLTSVGEVALGTLVLIPVTPQAEASLGVIEAGYPAGLALRDGTYRCSTIVGPSSPPLTAQQLVNALLAPDCHAYLAALSDGWAAPPCDPGGCAGCVSTGEAPPTSAGILLALLAVLAGRRRRRLSRRVA